MKHTIELDEKDIKKIIAKEFDVHEDQVTIVARKITRGYDPNEYETSQVKIEVVKTKV